MRPTRGDPASCLLAFLILLLICFSFYVFTGWLADTFV